MFNSFYISKANLLHNLRIIKKKTNAKVCAMVKANAYGVGLKEVVSILNNKVDYFGVVNVSEADEVRAISKNKILIVGALEQGEIKDYSYTCCSIKDIKYLISLNKKVNIHLKINTGMNRFGLKLCQLKRALKLIAESKLILEGVFTHFATADNFVDCQYKLLEKAVAIIKQQGFNPIVHADNSANITKHNLDMVRVGFKLYNDSFPFKPVVKITAKILQINTVMRGAVVGYDYNFVAPKKMRVAVVSLGYADGFLHGLIGCKIFVKGKACSVLNVCMDCFMLDVTDVNIKLGESIYIINKENNLFYYANYLHTSPYEIGTNFSKIRAKKYLI